MKYFAHTLSVAIFALFLIGCQKDSTYDLQKANTTTLSVSLAPTRTSLGEKSGTTYPVYWSEGDCIAVNGKKSDAVTINAEDRRCATFTINEVLDYPYNITYPHTATTSVESPRVVFPAEQSYVDGSFANESAPMCAYVAEKSNAISLCHLAGVLRFAIRGKEGEATALKSVTISCERAIAGEFDVDCQNATISPTESCQNSITLTLPDNTSLSAVADRHIYIAIPYGEYGECDIVFTDAEGRCARTKWSGATVKAGIVREFKSIVFDHKESVVVLEPMSSEVDDWAYDGESNVSGYIRCNGAPLEGVVVSDGLLCTKSNERGFFSLKSDLATAKFIMASIPSGYSAPINSNGQPIFYHHITEIERAQNLCTVDFSFNKIENNPDRFTMFIGADPQPRASTAGYDNIAFHSLEICEDFYRAMREKAATITDRNIYGFMLGDIVHENMSLFDNYIAGLKSLGNVQMFNILGNHDNDPKATNDVEGRRVFEEKLGPTYYSFNIGKIHCVVLDNLIMKVRSDGTLRDYDQGLTNEIWQWLQNDLSYVDYSTTIFVACHSPMFMQSSMSDRSSSSSNHRSDYAKLFSKYDEVHAWAGHSHTTFNYVYPATSALKNIEVHTVSRSTGQLWTNEYISCGTPRGYTVVEVDGDDVSWYFQPTKYQTAAYSGKTTPQPSYNYRDWSYNSSGVAILKSNGATLDESYQMKVYKPGEYHKTYADMIAGNAAHEDYIYVDVFLWDGKWDTPKYNGVEMTRVDYKTAYCLSNYEIKYHYSTVGYKLKDDSSYAPSDENFHTLFYAYEPNESGTGTVTVKDRFGNEYSSTVTW